MEKDWTKIGTSILEGVGIALITIVLPKVILDYNAGKFDVTPNN